jgi:uncharacterized protein (DUF58 family)
MNASRIQSGAARFLDPDVLSRISNLEILARTVVEGFITGLHRSPYKGFSSEFLEYRSYIPGDVPTLIDWKVFARSDRLFIKEFEDETNTNCHILLDISGSMNFSTTNTTKLAYGTMLAASLAYFMVRQRDRVGLYLFDDRIRERIQPRSTRGHLLSILRALELARPGTVTSLGKPFHELADSIRKRGIVVIISDLLDDPETMLGGLKHFRFDRNDIIVFHLMDPFEMTLPIKDVVEFEDMETGERMIVMTDEVREGYLENIRRFREMMRTECGIMKIDYTMLETGKPLDFALFQYLSKRSNRI